MNGSDLVILVILVAAVAVGMVYTVRHFKGQGGCCGSGGYKPKKKKLDHVTGTKEFRVEGMACENCANRVMEAVNDIPGVSGKVSLKKGIVTVSYEKPVGDDVIRKQIGKAGYKVV